MVKAAAITWTGYCSVLRMLRSSFVSHGSLTNCSYRAALTLYQRCVGGKARELAAKLRLQDAEQAEKDLLEAVHEGMDE